MTFTVYNGETDWRTTQDKDGLRRYAKTLGVEVDGRSGIETVREAIALKLGESLEPVPPQNYEPPTPPKAEVGAGDGFDKNKAEIARAKKWVVECHSTERDPHNASVGVNGVWFVVPRDKQCILPEPAIYVLQKAVIRMMRWDPTRNTNVPVNTPRYPVSRIREATEEDLKNPELNAQCRPGDAPQYSVV